MEQHRYVAGTASPLHKTFQAAGIASAKQKRTDRALLATGGDVGRQVAGFLAGAGVAPDQYTLVDLGDEPTAVSTASLVNAYLERSSQDLFYFPYALTVFHVKDLDDRPFITDGNLASRGISTSQLADGAWMLMNTGSVKLDPLKEVLEHWQAGIVQAAASGKIHFFYGMSLDENITNLYRRSSTSSLCFHVGDNCLGVPDHYMVGDATLSGYPAAFAFATYLMTWERMPERTGIAAVFDLAKKCAQELIAPGMRTSNKEETGLGRLDIGCMAREAAAATVCPVGEILVGKGDCRKLTCPDSEVVIAGTCVRKVQCPAGSALAAATNSCAPLSWWARLASHQYLAGTASPHQEAFGAVAGERTVDRSAAAWLLDGGTDGAKAIDLLGRIGLGSGRFSYMNLGNDLGSVSSADVASSYLSLSARDMVNFSHSAFPFITDTDTANSGISAAQLRTGAWILADTGSGGSLDPLAALAAANQAGTKAAAATGKIHFYYELDASLTARATAAGGCQNIGSWCIGAPGRFSVELRDGTTETLAGKASTFAFAAYVMAWERMPKTTGIGAVFDLALSRCVRDLGASGVDDQTGAGRLDIGCLAWEASRMPECPPGQVRTDSGTCQAVACPAQILLGAVCVPRSSCATGTTLTADNTCRVETDWSGLAAAPRYAIGTTSPLQQAFATVTLATATASRSAQAYFFVNWGDRDRMPDLLGGMGVAADGFRLVRRSAPAALLDLRTTLLVLDYLQLSTEDLAAFSYPLLPFVTAAEDTNVGIKSDLLEDGGWLLVNTGDDGNVDPLASLPQYYRNGTREAAATGKVHFFYGLDSSLTGRASASNGCKNIGSHCIGVPWQFSFELRDGTVETLTGSPASFAFAAYVMAWERMPKTTSIAAVFAIARSCVQNLGSLGIDDDTGLGRLDIGCLAWEAATATDCGPDRMLVSKAVCTDGLWPQLATHRHAAGTASPLARAFAAAGIGSARVDRSADAYVVDTGGHGSGIRKQLTGIGLAHSGGSRDYSYVERRDTQNGITGSYLLLSSFDLVNYSAVFPFVDIWRPFRDDAQKDLPFPEIRTRDIQKGAWLLVSAGNTGSSECLWTTCLGRLDFINEYISAANTGKIHFIYGLESGNPTARGRISSGCRYVETRCIGAPFSFYLQPGAYTPFPADDIPSTLAGTSQSAPFVFAAYLMAWQRMPAGSHISAVYDLALSCVEDIGEPGPDADTGAGRLDIGCLAERTAQVPQCHPGHVLVAAAPPVCTRFSYWDDMRRYMSLEFSSYPVTRAFADVGLAAREADRSASVHVAAAADSLALLSTVGLAHGTNYTRVNAPGNAAGMASLYGGLAAGNLLSVPAASFGEFFTSDKSTAPGLARADVAAGAHMIMHVDSHADTQGQIDPASSLISARQAGVTAIAATGRVHFLYGLNESLTGRHRNSDGCRNIESRCIGVPYTYWTRPAADATYYAPVDISSNQIAEQFALAAYVQTWERMPAASTVSDLFALAVSCAEDLGADGADAETGLGRLDIGCLAYETYRLHNPAAVESTVVIAETTSAASDMDAYMDDFAQGLFGSQIGFLALPGASDIGLQVGFAGDSFGGTYRPVASADSYRAGTFATRDLPRRPGAAGFGLRVGEDRAGLYYRVADAVSAGFTIGRSDSFFGGSGSGRFSFDCTVDLNIAVSVDRRVGPASRLTLAGGINSSRASCISGSLLDRLQGIEAGLVAGWQGGADDGWQLSVQAWASRFVGGKATVAGSQFAIDKGPVHYGGKVQASYSF